MAKTQSPLSAQPGSHPRSSSTSSLLPGAFLLHLKHLHVVGILLLVQLYQPVNQLYLLRRWVTMISILFIQRIWNQLMMTTNHPIFIPNYTQSQWNRGETVVWRRVASFGVVLPSSCRHNAPMIHVSTKQDRPNPPRSAALPPTSVVVSR